MEIINNNASKQSNTATHLSFKEYQSIYSTLTGKVENLRKIYCKAFLLKKNNIFHLKDTLETVFKQYNIVTMTSNVIVSQSNKIQKSYSSVENFLAVDTLSKKTEEIQIEYNLLIQVPKIEKLQNYKITLSILSDLIALKKLKDIPHELLGIIEKNNIKLNIDYIDYTIAKSIQNTIDEWVDDISIKEKKIIQFISTYKNIIINLVKNLIVIFTLVLIIQFIPKYIQIDTPNFQIFMEYIILSLFILFYAHKFSFFISNKLFKSLSFLSNFSFIEFTVADKKNIDDYNNNLKKRIALFFISILGTITYGVVSSIIVKIFL